jgi:hypothetical protein
MNYAVQRASLSNQSESFVQLYDGLRAIVSAFLTYQFSNRHPNTAIVSKTNSEYNSEAIDISPRRWPTLSPLSELVSGVVYRRTREHLRSVNSSVSDSDLRQEVSSPAVLGCGWRTDRSLCVLFLITFPDPILSEVYRHWRDWPVLGNGKDSVRVQSAHTRAHALSFQPPLSL